MARRPVNVPFKGFWWGGGTIDHLKDSYVIDPLLDSLGMR